MGKKKIETEKDNNLVFPLLNLDNIVLTPMIPQPVKIETAEQQEYMEKCLSANSEIFIATSEKKESVKEELTLRPIGLVCIIDRVFQMPGAPTLAFVRPSFRAQFQNIVYSPKYTMAKVTRLKEISQPKRKNLEEDLTLDRIEGLFHQIIEFIPEPERSSAAKLISENTFTPVQRLYALTHVAPITWEEKYRVISANTYHQLVNIVAHIFDEAQQRLAIQAKIQERTHHEISQQQKENFLRIHLKQVKEELGESDEVNDFGELIERSLEKTWNEETGEHFQKELQKLRRLNLNNPEYSIQYTYLDNFLNLPWNKYTNVSIDLDKVEEILNRDHYGLEKVKDRVLEYMAVAKLRNDLKAPILCLYGPPGVGKTSIGKSIAEAVGREYKRISLGGMHDEAEIRGHRRTYIGAMPGRFMDALSKCEFGDPLILLDEIDKVGKDFKGDPSSALLEALDPEQNNTFHDNFIDFPYDLSRVLFIATANDLSTIPAPLRDRMEIIEMSGYIPDEKREIALRHLVAKALQENGFEKNEISFTPESIDAIVRYYTREAGVRQLEKKIAKVIRRLARFKATGKSFPTVITPEMAEELLGKKEVLPDDYENNDYAGVATGLAWTPAGGDILFIETSLSPGKGEKITLTGNLGDVMKESAMIALQYLKANANKLGIDAELFSKYDVHIHVPEGAVPKDGPSAGITLTSALLSAFTGRKMKDRTAMTGEITLRGKVLPVGGIKEKIIAARQAGIQRIILSEENRKDIEEIDSRYLEGLDFIYVKTLPEVFSEALSQEKALYPVI